MTWINTDHYFGEPKALVRIPAYKCRPIADELFLGDCKPESLAMLVRLEITACRPDLNGLIVCGIRQDFARWELQAVCIHPSFARVGQGEMLPEISLDEPGNSEECGVCPSDVATFNGLDDNNPSWRTSPPLL